MVRHQLSDSFTDACPEKFVCHLSAATRPPPVAAIAGSCQFLNLPAQNLGIESTPVIQKAMHTISAMPSEHVREPAPWQTQWIC